MSELEQLQGSDVFALVWLGLINRIYIFDQTLTEIKNIKLTACRNLGWNEANDEYI